MVLGSKFAEKVNITTEFSIFTLEENNYILLAGCDAAVYFVEPIHKNSPTFVCGHRFSTYLMTDAKICW